MNSVSVFLATYNRAASLRDTLEAMCRVNCAGLEVEWIVINNNCSDDTDAVAGQFASKLNLRLLHEPNAGKNRALNRGLNSVTLREIVVFTDDDVSPKTDWLHEAVAACQRWPEDSVFGGKVLALWPNGQKPDWIDQPWLLSLAFSHHDLGDQEMPYPHDRYPFGPSFWVRRRVFDQGRRYRENIGPVGGSRIMGSETSFLKDLADDGYRMIYCPKSVVDHRIKEQDSDPDVIIRRAISYGRGRARIRGVNYHNLLTERPAQWRLRQRLKLIRAYVRLGLGHLRLNRRMRMDRVLKQYIEIGSIQEGFRIAQEANAQPCRR